MAYQMGVGKRFAGVTGVARAMDLRDGDLHSALPIHVALRHKLKIQSAALYIKKYLVHHSLTKLYSYISFKTMSNHNKKSKFNLL